MNSKWTVLICTVLLSFAAATPGLGKDYDSWKDESYDFRKVEQIYIDEIHTEPAGLHGLREYRLKAYFFDKSADLEDWTVMMPPLQPHAAYGGENISSSSPPRISSASVKGVTSSSPGDAVPDDGEAPAEEQPASPDAVPDMLSDGALPDQPLPPEGFAAIPDEALASGADIYVTAQILAYQVGRGIIPAHTEWNSYWYHDRYYDHRGRPRWFARRVVFPVYVPDTYVPVASVGVQFCVYDVPTGRLVAMSEDIRTRGSSSDIYGVYKRIINRFYKNLKKDLSS